MSKKFVFESGQEIELDAIEEIKKAPGDNPTHLVFVRVPHIGRVRYVATQADVDTIEKSRRKVADARREDDAAPTAAAVVAPAARPSAPRKAGARKAGAKTTSRKAAKGGQQ